MHTRHPPQEPPQSARFPPIPLLSLVFEIRIHRSARVRTTSRSLVVAIHMAVLELCPFDLFCVRLFLVTDQYKRIHCCWHSLDTDPPSQNTPTRQNDLVNCCFLQSSYHVHCCTLITPFVIAISIKQPKISQRPHYIVCL